jgi:sulfatase maturation enzyme AslB (radical SAM superfamily)
MTAKYAIRAGPTGIHLFDRQSGTNILCDEVIVPPSLWSRCPRQVSIALTNACDLRCAFCYAPKISAGLDNTIVSRWLVELSDHGCLGVGFGGGEPMLYPALVDVCGFATENTRLAVTITTHGHHITESIAEALRGKVNFIRVSVDAVGLKYEAIRGRSFEQLRNKICLIRALSPFGVNCVVNSMTVDGLSALSEFAANEGASEILLLPQRKTNKAPGVDFPTMERLRAWIGSYRGPLQLSISEEAADGLPVHMDGSGEQGPRSYAHIDAKGTLRRTSFDSLGAPIGQSSILEALDVLARQTT